MITTKVALATITALIIDLDFSAFASGYRTDYYSSFSTEGNDARWWSRPKGNSGYRNFGIKYYKSVFFIDGDNDGYTSGFSVRCIKN